MAKVKSITDIYKCFQVIKICLFISFIILAIFSSCSASKKISRIYVHTIANDSSLNSGHIGISIYEPANGNFLYNLHADKYFIPGSTVKLFTLYAALKHLGDSVPSMHVQETNDALSLYPAGDPTLLHPDFQQQPVLDILSRISKPLNGMDDQRFKTTALGNGWAWDDYNESFMNERSALPVFGNSLCISGSPDNLIYFPKGVAELAIPAMATRNSSLSMVIRDPYRNIFHLQFEGKTNTKIVVPFITSVPLAFKLLSDTLHKHIAIPAMAVPADPAKYYTIYSRPVDSLYAPMISNSDNFFAEQTLLMSSHAFLGYMSEADMIDTLLNSSLDKIPQRPRWVDGSGLSRYNLFTPKTFIYILEKLQEETGIERLKTLLPTGGKGTLKNYFRGQEGLIYAKTGSLSNNSSLCGFMFTKKGRMLLFAIMANNYPGSNAHARRTIEKFLQRIWIEN